MNISFNNPFALIKRQGEPNVIFVEGKIEEFETLSEIPRKNILENNDNLIYDSISVLPFSQIKEKGYKVREGKEKILTINIEKQEIISLHDLINIILPDEDIELSSSIEYSLNEQEYGNIIKKVIKEEIGNGEGANFVIPRVGKAKIKDNSKNKILSFYKKILKNEKGAYWSFLFYDGSKYIIGSSPERNVSVKNNKVKMNPISGTFRKPEISLNNILETKESFMNFLQNKKEINELFMVVDEELKMMSNICNNGGMITGPLLKEMSNLIHTEYLLSGETNLDVIDVLRESMYAATVTGSPIENACNIIYKYEKEPRRYYASAIALIGRENKKEFLDSCITIRTLEISNSGDILLRVGGTLVRDSNIQEEVEETKYKISSMIDSLLNSPKKSNIDFLNFFKNDDDIAELLQTRNQYLSNFWFFNQNNPAKVNNKKAIIIHNGDDFCYMIRYLLSSIGFQTKIIKYYDYDPSELSDIIIVGPGPGDPTSETQLKMEINSKIIQELMSSKKIFIAICLGHQLLCKELNIPLVKKNKPYQGVQKEIIFFNKFHKVGFYNTFEARYKNEINNISISYNKTSKEIYGLKSEFFHSYQFHVESILTQDGYNIISNSITELIKEEL